MNKTHKIKFYHIFFCLFIVIIKSVYSQNQELNSTQQTKPDSLKQDVPQPDSLRQDEKKNKIKTVKEVIITASSILTSKASRATATSVLTKKEISNMNAISSADALKGASGVIVREYGGLGSLQTTSIRGTTSQQNIVLIDGIRYSSSSNDAFDFSLIPAYSLNKIEVMHGALASQYGANALGGAINLVTEPSFDAPFAGNAFVGIGSFGEKNISTSIKLQTDSGSNLSADAVYRGTNGNFPFEVNEFGKTKTLLRENAQAEQLFGKIIWNKYLCGWNFKTSFYAVSSKKGVPGAVVQGNTEMLNSNLHEQDLFGILQLSNNNLLGTNTKLFLTAKQNQMFYNDPDSKLLNNKENKFLRSELSCGFQSQYIFDEEILLSVNCENNYSKIAGSFFQADSTNIYRNNVAVAAKYEQSIPTIKTLVDAGLRADFFAEDETSKNQISVNPALGFVFSFSDELKIRSRFSTSFRMPSFTELYYLNFGNKDLKPEKSVSLDAGVVLGNNNIFSELNFFVINTTDQIISVPKSAVVWSAMNISQTLSRGVEFSVQFANFRLFETADILATINYSLLETVDKTELSRSYNNQIPYTPNELFSIHTTAKIKDFAFSLFGNYQSHRYFLPINLPEYSLGKFFILNATATQSHNLWGFRGSVKLECLNIFNADYVLVKNYPMPKRSFKLGVEFNFF